MPLILARPQLEVAVAIASGASQSQMLNLEDVVAAGYFVPSAFTNTGAVNLMRFGVSNDHDDPGGTPTIALLPSTAIATAQSQQQSVSTWYPVLPDVLKFRSARFDGVTTEAAGRTLNMILIKGYVRWKRKDYSIANAAQNSDVIATEGAKCGSFFVPAAFTGTTVTFLVGDGGTMTALATTADVAISQGVAVSRWIPIPDGVFAFSHYQIRSGSAEGAARVLRVEHKYVG